MYPARAGTGLVLFSLLLNSLGLAGSVAAAQNLTDVVLTAVDMNVSGGATANSNKQMSLSMTTAFS